MAARLRVVLAAAATVLAAAAVGCGGERIEEPPDPIAESSDVASLPAWVAERLTRTDGDILGVLLGTVDHAVGSNRLTFVVVRPDGSIVQAPDAQVYLGEAAAEAPIEARARLVPLGAHSHAPGTPPHDHAGATDIYVTSIRLSNPGRYWMVVETGDGTARATGMLDVARRTVSPAVGTRAIASDNPTLADAPAERITTARPPDTELLRYSIAESLHAQKPFVVAFATPAHCRSRVCGPVVDVVDDVRKRARVRGSDVRFIHVEVFRDNDPGKGYNRWMREWRLPTEPWVFLVDRKGVIRAKFEGAVSVDELEAAIEKHLL